MRDLRLPRWTLGRLENGVLHLTLPPATSAEEVARIQDKAKRGALPPVQRIVLRIGQETDWPLLLLHTTGPDARCRSCGRDLGPGWENATVWQSEPHVVSRGDGISMRRVETSRWDDGDPIPPRAQLCQGSP